MPAPGLGSPDAAACARTRTATPRRARTSPSSPSGLSASALLRDVFLEALAAGCLAGGCPALEPLYNRRAEALERTGKMPVGLFRDADRRHHRTCLTAWAASASDRGLLRSRALRSPPIRPRRRERARSTTLGPSVPIDVPLPGADGTLETVCVRALRPHPDRFTEPARVADLRAPGQAQAEGFPRWVPRRRSSSA